MKVLRKLPTVVAAVLALIPAPSNGQRPALRPLPLPGVSAPSAVPVDPGHFTIVLAGDNRSAGRGVPMPPSLEQIFREIALIQPSLVLWTGDTIYGSDDTVPEAADEYSAFLQTAALGRAIVYNAPGNHEIFNRKDLEDLYRKRMGALYGSFDYGNTHFIALNTEEIDLQGGIGPEQLQWLQLDLEASKYAANTIVFMHHPLFPKDLGEGWNNTALRDKVHQLLVRHGVKNVYSGHEHLLYSSVHDGINYTVSGGGGAPSDALPQDGGYLHYLLIQVDGTTITATVLQPWHLLQRAIHNGVEVSNYNYAEVPLALRLRAAPGAAVLATWAYKGKTHALPITVSPSSSPGYVTVHVTAPISRALTVTARQ